MNDRQFWLISVAKYGNQHAYIQLEKHMIDQVFSILDSGSIPVSP